MDSTLDATSVLIVLPHLSVMIYGFMMMWKGSAYEIESIDFDNNSLIAWVQWLNYLTTSQSLLGNLVSLAHLQIHRR